MSDTIIVVVKETQTVIVSAPGPQGAAGPGVPLGGAADQGLIKNSATNYDTAWGIPGLNTVSAWAKQQYHPLSTLAINGDRTIDWNWNTQPQGTVTLPNGFTYTLNLPSNRQPGIKTLRVYQDSIGGGVLTYNLNYIIDTSIASITYAANTFVDLYFRDDGSYIVVFGAEYTKN